MMRRFKLYTLWIGSDQYMNSGCMAAIQYSKFTGYKSCSHVQCTFIPIDPIGCWQCGASGDNRPVRVFILE